MLHLARWLVAKVVGYTIGILYPAFMSFKSLESGDASETGYWLTYWIVWSMIVCVEVFELIIDWIPLYYELKLAFVVYLIHPSSRGAARIFVALVKPLLQTHEQRIDEGIGFVGRRTSESFSMLRERAEAAGISIPDWNAQPGGGGGLRQRGGGAQDPEAGFAAAEPSLAGADGKDAAPPTFAIPPSPADRPE